MKTLLSNRNLLGGAPRIVVKVGSSSLTAPDGSLHVDQLSELVDVLAAARERGQQVVLVSSGAVAAGIGPLGFRSRPKDVRDQQAASMVGQVRLLGAYEDEFEKFGVTIAQVLLTPEDVMDRKHYANVQAALGRLLNLGVIPIVNENDAVVTDDLRFGDNDRLAALVAHVVDATALILCTDVDGLYTKPPSQPGAELISEVNSVEELENLTITGRGSDVGTGGMSTKVDAADMAVSGGIGTLVTSTQNLGRALDGETVGTWFVPRTKRVSARTVWLKYAAQDRGTLTVDDGAARVLRAGGASLLAVGITRVEGTFSAGDLVRIVDSSGNDVARGLSAYSDAEVSEFVARGTKPARPVVHVDDLVRR